MKKKQRPNAYFFLKVVFVLLIGSGIFFGVFGSLISQKINNWLVYSHLIGQEMVVIQNGELLLLEFGLIRANYSVRAVAPMLEGDARFPEWSPDGEWIAFDYYEEKWGRWSEAERSIYVVKADGTSLERIVGGVSPQWDSSGRTLYYTDWNDYETIRAIDLDTRLVREVLQSRDCGVGGIIGNYHVSLSDNRVLVQIYGSTYEWIPETESCRAIGYGWDANWSLNGDIALGSYSGGFDLFQQEPGIVELDGGRRTYHVDGGSPSWSPDGRYFVYDAPNDVNLFAWSLYIYDTVREDVYDLGMDFSHPSWRP